MVLMLMVVLCYTNPAADGIQDAGVSDVCFDPAGYVRI